MRGIFKVPWAMVRVGGVYRNGGGDGCSEPRGKTGRQKGYALAELGPYTGLARAPRSAVVKRVKTL